MMILNTETLSIEAGQSLFRVPLHIYERESQIKRGSFQILPEIQGTCELSVQADFDANLQTEFLLGIGQYLFEDASINSLNIHGVEKQASLLQGRDILTMDMITDYAQTQDQVEVAIVAVVNEKNDILLGKRPKGNFMPGVWEHPGGKLDPGESPQTAASRELQEEIAINIKDYHDLYIMDYAFANRTLKGYVSLVTTWDGDPRPRVHEELKWVKFDDLNNTSMPLSNLIHLSKTIDLIKQREV